MQVNLRRSVPLTNKHGVQEISAMTLILRDFSPRQKLARPEKYGTLLCA